jgi:hypothetical protein
MQALTVVTTQTVLLLTQYYVATHCVGGAIRHSYNVRFVMLQL